MGKARTKRDTADDPSLLTNKQQMKQKVKTHKSSIENVQPKSKLLSNDLQVKNPEKLCSKEDSELKVTTEDVSVKKRKAGCIVDDTQLVDMKDVAKKSKKTKKEIATEPSAESQKKKKKEKKMPHVISSEMETASLENTVEKQSGKKKKKRENPTKQADEEIADESQISDSTAKYHALEYLRRWKHSRNEWSFQKVRQVWLLKSMYDKSKVADTDFDILLEYLEDLAGKARQSTIEDAEKKMKECDEEAENMSEDLFDRLRRVIQTLS